MTGPALYAIWVERAGELRVESTELNLMWQLNRKSNVMNYMHGSASLWFSVNAFRNS